MPFGKEKPCPQCARWEARYDALLDKYHSLRLAGNEPVGKLRVIPPKPDSGLQAIRAGERAITDPRLAKAFADLVAAGMPEADALREAERFIAIGTGRRTAETVTQLAGEP